MAMKGTKVKKKPKGQRGDQPRGKGLLKKAAGWLSSATRFLKRRTKNDNLFDKAVKPSVPATALQAPTIAMQGPAPVIPFSAPLTTLKASATMLSSPQVKVILPAPTILSLLPLPSPPTVAPVTSQPASVTKFPASTTGTTVPVPVNVVPATKKALPGPVIAPPVPVIPLPAPLATVQVPAKPPVSVTKQVGPTKTQAVPVTKQPPPVSATKKPVPVTKPPLLVTNQPATVAKLPASVASSSAPVVTLPPQVIPLPPPPRAAPAASQPASVAKLPGTATVTTVSGPVKALPGPMTEVPVIPLPAPAIPMPPPIVQGPMIKPPVSVTKNPAPVPAQSRPVSRRVRRRKTRLTSVANVPVPRSVATSSAPVALLRPQVIPLPPPPVADSPVKNVKTLGTEVKSMIDDASMQVLLKIQPNIPDTILQSGNFHLRNLKSSEEDFQRITRYFDNSKVNSNDVRVKSILRITRPSELEPNGFEDKSWPRKMLFHGTRSRNIGSILNEGFRPTKSNYDGGIFFADRAAKSLDYCGGHDENGIDWLFLCEVFLGWSLVRNDWSAHPVPGFDSIFRHGFWTPDEYGDKTISDCVWPMGKTIKRLDYYRRHTGDFFPYNEYIVHRPDQIRMKYLIQLEKITSTI